jgi:hypothetical protein
MTTVYVVTSGMYEDYSIDGVFSTKEKAEEFVKAPNLIYEYSYSIKEYKLDDLFNSEDYFTMADVLPYWQCTVYKTNTEVYKYDLTSKHTYKKNSCILKEYVERPYPCSFTITSLVSKKDCLNKAKLKYEKIVNL